jgi:diguanylate cyclase (GGDEF)-like protein
MAATTLRALLALGAVAIIGTIDATLSSRLLLTPLYGLVVALVAWHTGRPVALVVAVAAGAVRIASELAWYPPDVTVAWSGVAWTVAFAALAHLVGRVHAHREHVAGLENRISELIQIEHNYARTDPLTSLCNRRAFIDALQQAEARSRRSGGALAVARVDVDHFRSLNETYSRADGDHLLRAIATSLSLITRMGDLASRLENDEFAILLYGCSPDDAQRVGQRIVAEVAELGRAYPESRITASIGIACFTSPGPDPDEMMRIAGSALRRVRQAGGNAVAIEREWKPQTTNPA